MYNLFIFFIFNVMHKYPVSITATVIQKKKKKHSLLPYMMWCTSVFVCLYSGHSACNLGWPVLTLNLLSCDLRP